VTRLRLALLTLPWLLAACATPPPPSHADFVRGELAELLATDQPSCGVVRLYSRRGRLDYRVECASGQVFRVRVSADGHVLITPYVSP
jgi:hypothetical protein